MICELCGAICARSPDEVQRGRSRGRRMSRSSSVEPDGARMTSTTGRASWAFQWRAAERMLLLQFLYDPDGFGGGASPRGSFPELVHLAFQGVEEIAIHSPAESADHEDDLVDEWFWHEMDDIGEFTFLVGKLELQFRARALRFMASRPPT